jgi:type II secretory pathway pseudopilin PulG
MNDDSSFTRIQRKSRRGFLLLEVMIAVTIFALAVLAVGRSVENIISAQVYKIEDDQVRRFLDGRMSEIEAGAVPLSDSTTEDIKDWLPGAKLKTTRTQLKKKDEKGRDLFGLYLVNLELTWTSDGAKAQRTLFFYLYPRQR